MTGVQKTIKVIEFTSLPQNLRTPEIRKKFDIDSSGFLESKNSVGQNEIYRIEQAMGLDLSKYTKEASKVETTEDSWEDINWVPYQKSTMYDKEGKPSVILAGNKDGFLGEVQRTEINGNVETTRTYDKNLNIEPETNGFSHVVTKNVTYKGIKGLTKTEYKDEDGITTIRYERGHYESRESSDCASADFREIEIRKDKDGEIVYYEDFGTDPKTVTYDKYYKEGIGATKTFEFWILEKENIFSSKYGTLLKRKNSNAGTQYLLNGKQVQVKQVDNGRYEITQDGKTDYYSHDGIKLRMDYVTAKTTNLENRYKKKTSMDGKTAWYYNPQGKAVSQAAYHSNIVKNIKVKDGKFIYKGKELKSKQNDNGTYTVTIGAEDFTLKIKTSRK